MKYYDVSCSFPYIDNTYLAEKVFLIENYDANGDEYDFISDSKLFSLETKPTFVSLSPSFYWQYESTGTLTITGTNFDPTKLLYMRIEYKGAITPITLTTMPISTTSAEFSISPSDLPVAGNHTLTLSHYAQFPMTPSNHTLIVV